MAAKNEITGDSIQTKGGFSKEGEKNFDAIFPEKFETLTIRGESMTKCMKRCWLEIKDGNFICNKPGCEEL